MELIERDELLATLRARFERVADGEGHCVLVTGEAGIGKSSLVRAFGQQLPGKTRLYLGLCDALFTPRPLAPVYDVAGQMQGNLWQKAVNNPDRAVLFSSFLEDLTHRRDVAVIAFEDIHWADEATLDFIRFLARRIARVRCLFLLTFRDNEVNAGHPLRVVLGQLPPDSVTRASLLPLSKMAVERLATEKGYCGEDVYAISDGIPFYVREILAAYSSGVPENIKDSILSVYHRQPAETRMIWDILSVMPSGFEADHLERMAPTYAGAIEDSLAAKIILLQGGRLSFKHELYRRTIEANLSPITKRALNKRILNLFLADFEAGGEFARILQHAEAAGENTVIVKYAPLAAQQAAAVGSHQEASRLLGMAMEHYHGDDKETLAGLYERYSYECYLTNRMKEAIAYQEKALALRREMGDASKTGDCQRWLSRLWWFDGNRRQAEHYANLAIGTLKDQPVSRAKAMAFSNLSQLKMLSAQTDECIYWGEQAIVLAKELGDDEILSHALNNVGTARVVLPAAREEGLRQQEESLRLALQYSYHEHAARAYTNLSSMSLTINDLVFSRRMLDEGIRYCEERDLDSWSAYMTSVKARLLLRTGEWDEAVRVAEGLLAMKNQAPIVRISALVVLASIKMRRDESDVLLLLREAQQIASVAMELQRIIPVLVALLEYEWIRGERVIEDAWITQTMEMSGRMGNGYDNSEFAFWLLLARGQEFSLTEVFEGWKGGSGQSSEAAGIWQRLGSPYLQAMLLFTGEESEQRQALGLVQELGAESVFRRMSMLLRAAGVKNLPRGVRESTKSNVAALTQREVDVLRLLKEGLKNKEIASRLYISPKTVDHHISALLFKLDVGSRVKAVNEAVRLGIIT